MTIDNDVSHIPVQASQSPANQTKKGNSGTFNIDLSWAGGASNKYAVSFYDGRATIIDEPGTTLYSMPADAPTYNKGAGQSTKTWNTSLHVSNGSSDTADGTVTLKDN